MVLFVLGQSQRLNPGNGVGLGEVVLLLALFGDGHLVDHRVQTLGFQRREDAVPFGRLQFDLHAQLFGQGFGELDFEAGQFAVGIDETERWVSAFQTDVDHAGVLDFLQLLTGNRLPQQAGAERQAQRTHQQIST